MRLAYAEYGLVDLDWQQVVTPPALNPRSPGEDIEDGVPFCSLCACVLYVYGVVIVDFSSTSSFGTSILQHLSN